MLHRTSEPASWPAYSAPKRFWSTHWVRRVWEGFHRQERAQCRVNWKVSPSHLRFMRPIRLARALRGVRVMRLSLGPQCRVQVGVGDVADKSPHSNS